MRAFLVAVSAVVFLSLGCGPSEPTAPGTCDATTCSGCCDGDKCIAADGQDDQYCGASGVTCGGCGPHAHCGAAGCVPVDACATMNGGCDANATCTQYGVEVTCACPASFEGDGLTCLPLLSSLYLDQGYLSPVFEPHRTSYVAVLPAGTLQVTLTAGSQAAPVFFEIDGVQGPMRTIDLTASAQTVEVKVTSTLTRESRTVTVQLETATTTLAQAAWLKPSQTRAGMGFGRSLAVSGDGQTIAVGAPFDEGAGLRSGRVFVFKKGATAWAQEAVLTASNEAAYDTFGYAVALSTDGDTLLVGAPGVDASANAHDTGAAWVFRRTGTTWAEEAILSTTSAPGDGLGWSVALSGDGQLAALGAPFEDSDASGVNGSVSNAGGQPSSGAVFLFAAAGTSWSRTAFVKAPNRGTNDNFGRAVALSRDGKTLVVGAEGEDGAARTINGADNDDGFNRGAAYVYSAATGSWRFDATLKAPNADDLDRFGAALAVSDDGSTVAVGAPAEGGEGVGVASLPDMNGAETSGAVYVFRHAAAWTFDAYVKTTNSGPGDAAGTSVALSGDGATLVVGAPGEDSDSTGVESRLTNEDATDSGAAFSFVRGASGWARGVTIKAANTGAGDTFGGKLALGGTTLAIASPGDDSSATGVDGDAADNSAMESGAVTVFAP